MNRHSIRRTTLLAASLLSGFAVADVAFAQVPGLGPTVAAKPSAASEPLTTSKAVSQLVSEQSLEKAADQIGGLMGNPAARDKALTAMKPLDQFGKGQYIDRVYSRAIGTTTYDIIDKINFDRAIIYMRYTYHIEAGKWMMLNFVFKSEDKLPFPAEWVHVYP